jgi:hypothetical protein
VEQLLIAAASVAVQIALTVAAFLWAARCLKKEKQCSE